MKKPFFVILISLFIFIFLGLNRSFAQEIKVDTIRTASTRTITIVTIRTLPKFILQLNASYLSGSMEVSAHNGGFSADDFIKGKSFCARNGVGVNLSGKIPLSKKGNFWLDITADYNRFISNLVASNTASGKIVYNVFGGGLGVDYMFIATHKVKYFFGANSLFNVINGNASLINTDAFGSIQNVTIKSGFRIGYSIFTGFEVSFQKDFGLNFGVKYSHLNLFLKSTSPVTINSETNLNDDAVTPSQVFSGWKQFAYSSFFAGFSYYFGVKELRYKIPEK